jgi:hypothetical protein
MHKAVIVTIRETLDKGNVFSGWLYLPKQPWNLDTQGIFLKEDRDADPFGPFPPVILDACQLSEALDAAGIEDVIINAQNQINNPTTEDLFKAFLFYMENDTFIEFPTRN